ncbi:MAG: translation initiation factor [Chthoniobacterales bacterium]
MARNKDQKVGINPAQSGLNTAFSSLLSDIPTIPDTDETPKSLTPPPKRKRGRVILRKETAHRGGKTVIIVYDFETSLPLREIEDLGKQLRKTCGCGGTIRNREIEIQGEHAAKIRVFLQTEGFHVAGV